jgi:hypothetical protein
MNNETEEQAVVSLQDAKQALLNIRIVSSELDSGITNVNRGNPMLARALREKLGRMRKEFETLDYYLAAHSNTNSEEGNGEVQQKEQGSSKETSSGTETSTSGSNASTTDDSGHGNREGQDSEDASNSGGVEGSSSTASKNSSGDSRPMTAAEKIAARKKSQKGDSNES